MERIRVHSAARLSGEVGVPGAKNSALKLMAASVLAIGTTTLHGVPRIRDVHFMQQLLRQLGARSETVRSGPAVDSLTITVPDDLQHETDYTIVRRLRASISILGPLVGRLGQAKVALPGGDNIGSRGLDMHVQGLIALGASVSIEHGFVVAEAPKGLHGAEVRLDFPSVGATENIVMAAVLASGCTTIENAAREPEIVDICEFLNEMGAQIQGIGSPVLQIDGVDELHAVEHTTVPDRIVAATYAIGAVITRGDVYVRGGRPEHLGLVLRKLAATGAQVSPDADGFRVRMDGRPRSVDVMTLPYPGFPTDLQSMMATLAAVSEGTAMVTENLYDGRFAFVQELARLGADVHTDGHHAVIRGRERLSAAPVLATDIRAGAALVLAGLVADGETLVSGVHHIDRGYPDLVGDLTALGAVLTREPDDLNGPDG
jgi:UDP-N-acetylglucosamine 1-carboxyvinyltransferase